MFTVGRLLARLSRADKLGTNLFRFSSAIVFFWTVC
jgi:uncharacterized membrane protein YkgB